MPIASILIPVFNREILISESIKSAQNQTIEDIEIVVVDNNSNDGTWDVICDLANKDPRIKAYKNNENIGPVNNWIRCVENSTSPYSKILFSDDLIHPQFIEKTIPHLINPNCGLAYTQAIIGEKPWQGGLFFSDFTKDTHIEKLSFVRLATLLNNFTPVSPGAALFRTSDLKKNIFTQLPGVNNYDFRTLGAGVDWLIYVTTALAYKNIAYIAEPLAFFRAHPGSITVINQDRKVDEGYLLAKEWFKKVLNW